MKIAFVCCEDIQLGPAYIITHLKKQGHDVRLFFSPRQFDRGYARNKFLARLLSLDNYIIHKIEKFNPDKVLFSLVTATYRWNLQMAERIKKKLPTTKIIFGGVHSTLVPDEVKSHSFIDEVIVGDGVEHFGGVFDPDNLWPDRDIFFKELPSYHRKYQLFMTSFGCPYACSYCANEELRKHYDRKLIKRSVEGCIKELKYLKERGMKYVLFVDDILCVDREWLRAFAIAYNSAINLPFCCFGHPKFLDEEIIKTLKEMGCEMVWIGIQTGAEQLRKDILNRPETNDEIKAACALINKYNMKLMIDHIFGLPYESEMTNDFSTVFYSELKPDVVNCYELLYFPKAKIINHAIKFGYLTLADVPKIERGEMLQYHTGNRGNFFYDIYHKPMVVIPLGNVTWELLPTWLVKLIIYIRAGRAFIPIVMIQNEIYFTWKAILKKGRLI